MLRNLSVLCWQNCQFLRNCGAYTDATSGEQKQYQGKLFNLVVFNDAVQESLDLRIRLANYFDESNTEVIFDYISPEKTSQIFTLKAIIRYMINMLRLANPSFFNDSAKTFI